MIRDWSKTFKDDPQLKYGGAIRIDPALLGGGCKEGGGGVRREGGGCKEGGGGV